MANLRVTLIMSLKMSEFSLVHYIWKTSHYEIIIVLFTVGPENSVGVMCSRPLCGWSSVHYLLLLPTFPPHLSNPKKELLLVDVIAECYFSSRKGHCKIKSRAMDLLLSDFLFFLSCWLQGE